MGTLLIAALLLLTGISREESPELTAIAERRAREIVTDFSHNGQDPRYYEVLAVNSVGPTRAVQQWMESPVHRAIIADPALTYIGCAAVESQGATYAVCVLTSPPPPPVPTAAPSRTLPNTAMDDTPTVSAFRSALHRWVKRHEPQWISYVLESRGLTYRKVWCLECEYRNRRPGSGFRVTLARQYALSGDLPS